jgi:integrase
MAYIIERNERFYVVAYDGIDACTGRERRRWHPAGRSRADAEAIAARITTARHGERQRGSSALTVKGLLLDTWMPRRHRELRPSTASRYEWMIRNYIIPAIGEHRVSALRAEHLDRLYADLVDHGAVGGRSLALKTVYDVHVVIRCALHFAVRRHLVDHNVALDTRPPRATTRSRPSPEIWTAEQLATFLAQTAHLRLYPAVHLSATTGMRRGELAGLRWGDWQRCTHRLSIARSRQSVSGRTVEVPTKTAASRRCIDLDAATEQILAVWRRRQQRDGHPPAPMTQSSPTPPVSPSTPSRSPNCSTDRSHASASPGSGSTTFATPTPRYSSPTTSPSKSCPSGSATPTPASPWPPTSTCSQEWAPAPPPTSPPC